MRTPAGLQCDGCDKMIEPADVQANRFYKTVCPLICAESEWKKPAKERQATELIICLSCSPRIKTAIKLRRYEDFPTGRLKQITLRLILKYGSRNVKFF